MGGGQVVSTIERHARAVADGAPVHRRREGSSEATWTGDVNNKQLQDGQNGDSTQPGRRRDHASRQEGSRNTRKDPKQGWRKDALVIVQGGPRTLAGVGKREADARGRVRGRGICHADHGRSAVRQGRGRKSHHWMEAKACE